MSSFLTGVELDELGFKNFGKNVLISRKASIYSPEKMNLGDNVRIDDFCILSGNITIGNYVHVSAGVYLYGGDEEIEIKDFSGISAKCVIYAATDNFSGNYMVGSMIDTKYRNIIAKKVILEKFVQLGAGSIVMPGVKINEGAVTGSFTFVNKDLECWKIYTGIPAKVLKDRKRDIEQISEDFIRERGEFKN